MELIDWPGVARNALWIIGLSIVLAAWSHLRWWARRHGVRVRHAFDWPRFQVPFNAGLILFCSSLAWSSVHWWERGMWVFLGIASVWQMVATWLFARRYGWDAPRAASSATAGSADSARSVAGRSDSAS